MGQFGFALALFGVIGLIIGLVYARRMDRETDRRNRARAQEQAGEPALLEDEAYQFRRRRPGEEEE